MDNNLIFNKDIIKLFTHTFDNVANNNRDMVGGVRGNSYNWDNMKKYFTKLVELLVNFDLNKQNRGEYIKYYIFTKISFIYYINYLEYIDHEDALNNDIDTFNNEFKYNLKIIHKIHLSCKNPLKLLNILHPFFKNAKSYYNRDDETYLNICKTNKKYENICLNVVSTPGPNHNHDHNHIPNHDHNHIPNLGPNHNHDQGSKLISLITFNHNMVKNLDYNSYSEFYYRNVIDRKHYFNNNFIDFTNFVDNIPNYKKVLSTDVKNSNNKESVRHVRISEIIKFVLKYFPYLSYSKNNGKYVISHIKNGGKIIIEKSTESINIIFQYNLNLFYLNNPELKDITFFKNTNNFIKIKYQHSIITDLTSLLNTFYFITRSCKYIEYYANSINEILNIEQYNYCFYDTFLYFLSFIQKDIETNTYYKKFVIDIIKYYYLYSYYDYYFYNDVELVTMLNNCSSEGSNKSKIFDKFCYNIKKLFKIPNELLYYPPFFKIDNSNDNIFLYSYEYPNYIKLYDILYSISTVFKFSNKNIYDIINNLLSCNGTDTGNSCSSTEGTEDNKVNDGSRKVSDKGKGDMGDKGKGCVGDKGKGGMGDSGGEGESWNKGDGSYGISTYSNDEDDNSACDNNNEGSGNDDEDGDDGNDGDDGSDGEDGEDDDGSDGSDGSDGDEDGGDEGNCEGSNNNKKGTNKNNKFIELSDESSEDYILNTEHC